MKGTYWQSGEKIDYENKTETVLEANTVVTLGERIGIIGTNIEPGALGSVITEGVFILAKTDASAEIELGASLYFDGTGIVTTDSGNTPAGWAIKASVANDPEIYVKIG